MTIKGTQFKKRKLNLRGAVLIALIVALYVQTSASAMQRSSIRQVGQWDRFEESVTNSKSYTNPYSDVSLDVIYTRPDKTTVNFWGFHDGEQTWRIRFMPDQLGIWRYEAKFSDGSPGKSGTFQCIPSTIPGMIHKDETNPLWLGFKGGKHIFIRSFHVGPLFSIDKAKRETFLNWAQKQGYNMLGVRGHQSGVPALWPLDPTRFRQVESVLDDLSNRRIIVWGFWGFFGSRAPSDPQDRALYLKYCMARIGPYWNEIFNVGGPEIDKKKKPEEIDQMGEDIRRYDVFGHLLGVHQLAHDDYFRDRPWVSLVTLQIKISDLMDLNQTLMRNQPGGKPIYSSESCWAGNVIQFAKRGGCNPERLRHQLWVHFLSAATLNVADMNGNNRSGFSESMDLKDKIQERHDIPKMVWDYAQTVPFYRMSPSPHLVDNGICLAEPGQTYLVYLPSGGAVNVKVQSGKPYSVKWVNARNPNEQKDGGTTSTGQRLVAPDTNDWLLSISADSKGLTRK
jgi:hypothetical protein